MSFDFITFEYISVPLVPQIISVDNVPIGTNDLVIYIYSMKTREKAIDRVRVYPADGKKLRILAKKKGGKTLPADIIQILLTKAA